MGVALLLSWDRSSLAPISILCSSQWFSVRSTNVSSLKCKHLRLALVHILPTILKLAFWINYSKNPWKRAHSAISHRVINRAEREGWETLWAEAALCRQSFHCISFLFSFTLCFSFPLFSPPFSYLPMLAFPFFHSALRTSTGTKAPLCSNLNEIKACDLFCYMHYTRAHQIYEKDSHWFYVQASILVWVHGICRLD